MVSGYFYYRVSNGQLFNVLSESKENEIKINEVLSYDVTSNIVGIHVAPAEDLGVFIVKRLVIEGLKELASIVKANEKITEIEAVSWIVGKNQGLIEKC